jgi:hypothetical protein
MYKVYKDWYLASKVDELGLIVSNFLCPLLTNAHYKPEHLSQASLSSLVKCLRVRLEPTQVKHLSRATLQGRLLALPTNRLGWRGLSRRNTLAYYENSLIKAVKSFTTLCPGAKVMTLFTVIYECLQ